MTKISITEGGNKNHQIIEEKTAPKTAAHRAGAAATATHSVLQKSTTLSRKYVKRPSARKPVSDIKPAAHKVSVNKPVVNKKAIRAEKKAEKIAARDKDHALRQAERIAAKNRAQALKQVNKDRTLKQAAKLADNIPEQPTEIAKVKTKKKGHKVFFALLCSAATVGALVAFVHFNMPDISVRVAAFQTGIEATYPSFIPRDYSLAGVSSDKDGEIVMTFSGLNGASFTLSEEASTWDSNALLTNYVKKSFDYDYTTLREQGITIYAGGGDAAWVNGGMLYKIKATGKWLTKEQIRNIATSL